MKPWLADPDVTLYHGDVLETLCGLPDGSVDCVVTSPPYWGLRDYGTGQWEGGDAACDHLGKPFRTKSKLNENWGAGFADVKNTEDREPMGQECGKCGATRIDQQLGLEPTPDLFVARMVDVFREVRRVLAPHGTCWVNLGSSYFQGESYPLREIDAAWLAAIIDGEGCIQVHQQRRPLGTNSVDSFQVDLSVGMMTPEVVHRCHEITGLGSCKQQNRGVWDWSVRGQQAAQLLRAIYPYLLTKKRQAALAVMLADDLASRKYGRGNPAQPDVMQWRGEVRQAMSDLNQRRETSFPISEPTPIVLGLKPKDDCMVPARVALALQADGWYLRSEIVWGKCNPMPESVTDRPTKAHEMVYLLTKQPRYWFDQEAVREPVSPFSEFGRGSAEQKRTPTPYGKHHGKSFGLGNGSRGDPSGRNIRSVWQIATQPYPEAHFATYPEELVRRCVLAGCPEWVCRVCGKPRERIVGGGGGEAYEKAVRMDGRPDGAERRKIGGGQREFDSYVRPQTLGWSDCGHNNYRPGRVLDPFVGSGTTAHVARKHGRHAIGIDLNSDYLALAARRLQQLSLFAEPAA